MELCEYCAVEGKLSALFNQLSAAAKLLPVLGNPTSSNIIELVHYSADPNITSFPVRAGICCWTNAFTTSLDCIYNITAEMNPKNYKVVHIIRVGIPNGQDIWSCTLFSEVVNTKIGIEFELNFDVLPGEFARVPLSLDPTGKFYV